MLSKFSPRKSCRLWDNVEKFTTAGQATDDSIIRRMRFACWITKATHTLRIYIYCFSATRMDTRVHLSGTLYVHCLSCCSFVTLLYDASCVCAVDKTLWYYLHLSTKSTNQPHCRLFTDCGMRTTSRNSVRSSGNLVLCISILYL